MNNEVQIHAPSVEGTVDMLIADEQICGGRHDLEHKD